MTRISLGLAVLGGALAAGGLAAPAALAAGPACGDTITRSVTLRHDLTNCPADGLIIGADHVTLDLAGHTIDGDAVIGGDDTGVRLDGRRHVTVGAARSRSSTTRSISPARATTTSPASKRPAPATPTSAARSCSTRAQTTT